jgi:galactokinase
MVNKFLSHFPCAADGIVAARVPGRVNLMGDHTDYNGGLVLPCAIPYYTRGAARARDDGGISCLSGNLDGDTWQKYPLGVLATMKNRGYEFGGADIYVEGDIPIGAGLSSSASLEVLICMLIDKLYKLNIDPEQMARIAHSAETDCVGVKCGIMDQYAVAVGKARSALLLDCSSRKYEHIPMELGAFSIVIANSNKPHKLTDSKYNERRAECEEIARRLNVETLSELSAPPAELKRAVHVVNENARARRAADALKIGDTHTLGRLMNASHASLRDLYESSCFECDVLVDEAVKLPYCLGARITGGGWGGCTVSLVETARIDDFKLAVGGAYRKAAGLTANFYVI